MEEIITGLLVKWFFSSLQPARFTNMQQYIDHQLWNLTFIFSDGNSKTDLSFFPWALLSCFVGQFTSALFHDILSLSPTLLIPTRMTNWGWQSWLYTDDGLYFQRASPIFCHAKKQGLKRTHLLLIPSLWVSAIPHTFSTVIINCVKKLSATWITKAVQVWWS